MSYNFKQGHKGFSIWTNFNISFMFLLEKSLENQRVREYIKREPIEQATFDSRA